MAHETSHWYSLHVSGRTGRRVLVIDDDELSREVLSLLLVGEGYSVDVTGSGDEALLSAGNADAPPDIVLMDMQMPGISGEELGRRLRELCGASTQLIAMSGSRSEAGESRAFDAFLLKPFSMAELGRTLEARAGRLSQEPSEAGFGVALPEEVLDAQIFGKFQAMVGKEPLRELYGLCLSDAEKQLAVMRAAAAASDDAAFRKSAHVIKGSLGMLGAQELRRMCGLLEEVGLNGAYAATLADFPAALERLRGMLIALGVQL